ncbi:MAG: Zinc ribbon domain protein [Syntrophaceae bacterium PtaU1.Bin231]|nr:MAG: Zinc ribbon domain protein [Syntrophaceae bacterium PtaU1.Bin231]HOG16615.1 zinc ribbon domain-containing protein [Syntrophales bacterium]
MPIYEFRCRDCGEVSEIIVKLGGERSARCPKCKGRKMEKMLSSSNMSVANPNRTDPPHTYPTKKFPF